MSAQNATRTVVSSNGTLSSINPQDISENFLDDVELLHIDGHQPQAALVLAKKAKEMGITVSYDTGTYKTGSEELLKVADIVQAPIRFTKAMNGIDDLQEAAEYIRKTFGSKIVAVTDGENGVGYSSSEGTFLLPCYKIDTVVDSNGAGDIFAGGLIYGYVNKMSVEEMIKFAAASAAIKCTRFGKKELPTEKEVLDFIAKNS